MIKSFLTTLEQRRTLRPERVLEDEMSLPTTHWEDCGVVVLTLDLQWKRSWVRIPLGAYAPRQGILST